jgi:hypothetical protein
MYLDVSIVDIDVEKMEIVKISNGQLDKSIMSLRDIANYVTEACQTYLLANCNEDGFKDAIDGMTSALHIWAQAFYRFNW